MANLSPVARSQFFDSNGNPLSGGKLYTYEAGTTTPLATYSDSAELSANTNPIILDSRGECTIRLLANSSYKFVLDDSNDNTLWTVDNITAPPTTVQVSTTAGAADASKLVLTNSSGRVDKTFLRQWASVVSKTANYTATVADDVILCNASGGSFTITLPQASTVTDKKLTIKKTDSSTGAITITSYSSGSEAIDRDVFSGNYYLYAQDNYVTLVSDGTQWWIVAKDIRYQKIEEVSSLTNYPITINQWGDLDTISVPPGVYNFDVLVFYYNNGAGGANTNAYTGVGTVTGNNSTGLTTGSTATQGAIYTTASVYFPLYIQTIPYNVTSTTTYYLKGYSGSVTNLQYLSKIRANRLY